MTSLLSRSAAWLFGSLFLVSSAAFAADDVWTKHASENFVIYTASSEGKAIKVLEHLERVRRAYAYLLDVELGGEQPVNVLLFKNQKEYLTYSRTETSVGYYTQVLGQDFIVIADFNERVERVLNHEYFHLYARHQKFSWPTWANEGFADYFSTLKLTNKTLEVGHPIVGHAQYLRNTGRKLDAESLFAMSSDERHVAGRREVSDLYAMGWTLVHFIMSEPELESRRDEMIVALQRDDNSSMAFQEVYGWDLKKVDEQLRSYISRSRMSYVRMEVEDSELMFDAPVNPVEIDAWEAPLILANVLAFARKFDAAEQEYLRLAELYPTSAEVDDSRAQLLMMRGERSQAIPLLQSAIDKGSTNPNTYKFFVLGDCGGMSPTPRCLELTRKAVELSPEDKQLKFFNIGLLNRAGQFVQALLLANKVGKVTSEEAPRFFYLAAFAQYRLGKMDDAKESLDMGLKHAVSTIDRNRLEQLTEALERREMAVAMPVQIRRPITDGGPPVLTRPAKTDEREALTPEEVQARYSRNNPPSVESVAQRLVNSLTAEGTTLAEGRLTSMDCSTVPPALTVMIEAGAMKILIDDPSRVSIIRDGQIANDYQFSCGTQSGETIRVGYASSPDAPGVFLRLLQFGEL